MIITGIHCQVRKYDYNKSHIYVPKDQRPVLLPTFSQMVTLGQFLCQWQGVEVEGQTRLAGEVGVGPPQGLGGGGGAASAGAGSGAPPPTSWSSAAVGT